jgi:hypothetical protein
MSFSGCPHSGLIYDESGYIVHQVPEHAREDFRRSAGQHGIKLLDSPKSPQNQPSAPTPAPKAPQPQ